MSRIIVMHSQGKLLLKNGSGPVQEIESPFARDMMNAAQEVQQRNEWKTQGAGARFMVGGRGWEGGEPQVLRIQMTAVCRGTSAGQLFYAIETDRVGGLLMYDLQERRERRLFHRENFRVRDLDHHPELPLAACSVPFPDGSSNLGIVDDNRSQIREVTSGDSADEAPSWIPGAGQHVVFQSAGLARNEGGHVTSIGAFALQRLDVESGALETVLQDAKTDHLLPHQTASGDMFFIRRPYEAEARRTGLMAVLGDVLLFPFRLSRAVIDFLNFFSLTFSKKPLLTAGRRTEGETLGNLMLRGRMIDARKALRTTAGKEEAPALVPKSWQLVRHSAGGDETVIAEGVVAYDLTLDGKIIYTNGRAVFESDGVQPPALLLRHELIEHIVVMS